MLNVGIIGCGNTGNQVCAYCANKYPDIPVVAINCSENDMVSLPNTIQKFLIGDGKGAGKNREEAKKFLEDSIVELVSNQSVKQLLADLDIVFIVSSTGGGTGSGISIILSNVIQEIYGTDGVLPITVGVLPTMKEGLSTQANSLSYLQELYELSTSSTYMLYDNDKMSKLYTVEMLKKVNEAIVEDINILRGYYNGITTYNSIDERDAMTLIATAGRLFVASLFDVKEKDIDDDITLEDKLITEIKKNAQAEIQMDGIVNRTGVIVNLSDSMLGKFDTHVPKVQKLIGSPIEEFEHVSVNSDRKLANNIFFIASGLTPINDRIRKIKDRIDEINELQKKKEDDMELDSDMLSQVQSKRKYRDSESAPKDTQVDIGAIFNKFRNKV
jgi:cell division GTPase FtsZ